MSSKNYKSSLVILTTLFFMWGFLTCMNDILIPYLKDIFELKYWQAMLIQFAFFGAYFIGSLVYFLLSLRIGDPINRIGYKNGIVIGLLIAGLGCFLFYPAAQFQMYGFFLAALFILGLGFTMLQIAANPYVSILGEPETASSRLNMSQAFNSLGTTIAPILGGYLIFEFFFDEAAGGDAVKVPYLIFGLMFLIGAIVFKLIKLPNFVNDDEIVKGTGALKFPNLSLGTLAIFTYVGGEVAIGSFLINFIGLDEIMGLEEAAAKNFLAYYWGGTMIGRFSGAISLSDMSGAKKYAAMALMSILSFVLIFSISGMEFSSVTPYLGIIALNFLAFVAGKSIAGRTLGLFASISVALLLTAISTDGSFAMWALIGVGIFNSIMWPNIFTIAIAGLGKYTSQGSSLLVMAILGAALVPLVQGVLADMIGLQMSFVVPVVCYLYIVFYGFYSAKFITEESSDQKPKAGFH
ncbi:sugar MFS transporter [Reichenbachiella carrageenanivorans]|uniref:Sugar MFS transporter n=1 Tax=Reichenbachiella carrageenanivorans TaxID=2979869 RepID=A0ABY6D4G7_9BACT|nr:sugar MFS transporter [Reichenbachiella carrageenanivorans]UXX81044.1 sugar MFS transporter [Reichenbachiella carrageenanivorans]